MFEYSPSFRNCISTTLRSPPKAEPAMQDQKHGKYKNAARLHVSCSLPKIHVFQFLWSVIKVAFAATWSSIPAIRMRALWGLILRQWPRWLYRQRGSLWLWQLSVVVTAPQEAKIQPLITECTELSLLDICGNHVVCPGKHKCTTDIQCPCSKRSIKLLISTGIWRGRVKQPKSETWCSVVQCPTLCNAASPNASCSFQCAASLFSIPSTYRKRAKVWEWLNKPLLHLTWD